MLQFTNGRTSSLREMTRDEFNEMCDMLQFGGPEEQAARERELKRARSSVLLRMGRLGINTVDNWAGIDAFCLSPKIAGKKFAAMSVAELENLVPKLESILRKGGLKALEEGKKETKTSSVVSIIQITNSNKFKS